MKFTNLICMSMNWLKRCTVLLVVVILTGCSSGGTADGTADGTAELQGVFRATERAGDTGDRRIIQFTGGFIRSNRQFLDHVSFPTNDHCDPIQSYSISGRSKPSEWLRNNDLIVGAGDSLVVTNDFGTLADINERYNYGGFEDYFSQDYPVQAAMLQNLILDIPGDIFPAYSGVQIPDIDPVVAAQPDLSANVTAETVFRWVPKPGFETFVGIGASFVTPTERLSLNCFVIDDGEFALPDDVKSRLGNASAEGWSVSRRHHLLLQRSDSILEIQRSTSP